MEIVEAIYLLLLKLNLGQFKKSSTMNHLPSSMDQECGAAIDKRFWNFDAIKELKETSRQQTPTLNDVSLE